jgi:hypothetical protein
VINASEPGISINAFVGIAGPAKGGVITVGVMTQEPRNVLFVAHQP